MTEAGQSATAHQVVTVSALLAVLAIGAVAVPVATQMSSRLRQVGILKAITSRIRAPSASSTC